MFRVLQGFVICAPDEALVAQIQCLADYLARLQSHSALEYDKGRDAPNLLLLETTD